MIKKTRAMYSNSVYMLSQWFCLTKFFYSAKSAFGGLGTPKKVFYTEL